MQEASWKVLKNGVLPSPKSLTDEIQGPCAEGLAVSYIILSSLHTTLILQVA